MQKVGDCMSAPALTIGADALAHDAVQDMFKYGVGALLVMHEGKCVGIVTKTDWRQKVLDGEGDPRSFTVESIMTRRLIVIGRDEPLTKASILMKKKGFRHVAVTHENKIVGVLSMKDLEKRYENQTG